MSRSLFAYILIAKSNHSCAQKYIGNWLFGGMPSCPKLAMQFCLEGQKGNDDNHAIADIVCAHNLSKKKEVQT